MHEEYADKFNAIKDGLSGIQSDCARIQTEASALEAAWTAVAPTTKDAMAALADFTESVEMLYSFEHAKTSAQVRSTERRNRFVADQVVVCDEDAKAVAARFKTVAERVAGLPSEAAKVSMKQARCRCWLTRMHSSGPRSIACRRRPIKLGWTPSFRKRSTTCTSGGRALSTFCMSSFLSDLVLKDALEKRLPLVRDR